MPRAPVERLCALATAAALVPIWIFRYFPTQDGPSHLYNAFVLSHYFDASSVVTHAYFALNPRLSVAHKFYANLEAETGRAREAIVRLLGQATRHGNDPELFAGLVHACRYAGLYEESMAAHAEARRLDPHITTSFQQTLLMMRNIDRLVAA